MRVQKEPDDTVMTWPHLLSIEFLAAAVCSVFLLLMGLFINAPLEELANGNVTPAVAKAPWYFLGLQELLAYFHPVVSGVMVPAFVLVGAALIPYVDRGNILATRPSQRKTAVVLFTLFCILGLVVTFVGDLLPRPGLLVRDPVRDHERAPLRALTPGQSQAFPFVSQGPSTDEQLSGRARGSAASPHQAGHQVAAREGRPGPVATAAAAHLARRRRRSLAARGDAPARSASSGRTSPAASAAASGSARSRSSSSRTAPSRSTRASRPTCPRRARSSS